jgi:hypothetical protein
MANRKFGFELSYLRQDTIPFLAKNRQTFNLAQGIPKDYFLHSFFCRLTFRETISGGTTNGTVTADAGPSLVERFEVSGNHKQYGDLTRMLLQGNHVYRRALLHSGFNHENSVSAPWSGAVASYDAAVTFHIPFVPPRLRAEEQLMYLMDTPLWNTLNLFVDWGDQNSAISGGDRVLALSAFGSAGGSPLLTVTRVIAKLKGDRFKVNSIPIKESYKQIYPANSFGDGLITPLNVGNFMRSIWVVTGVLATGASAAKAGDNPLTYNDGDAEQNTSQAVVTRLKIKRDDILQRDVPWRELQQINGMHFRPPVTSWNASNAVAGNSAALASLQGHNLVDFVASNAQSGDEATAYTSYDTRQLALQNLRFELWGDVTQVANNFIHVIQTEYAGVPVFKKAAAASN